MSIAEELEKLQNLHQSGALNSTEYEQAKAAVLAPGRTAAATPAGPQFADVGMEAVKTFGGVANRAVDIENKVVDFGIRKVFPWVIVYFILSLVIFLVIVLVVVFGFILPTAGWFRGKVDKFDQRFDNAVEEQQKFKKQMDEDQKNFKKEFDRARPGQQGLKNELDQWFEKEHPQMTPEEQERKKEIDRKVEDLERGQGLNR